MPDFYHFTGVINSATLTEWEVSVDSQGREFFKVKGSLNKEFMLPYLQEQMLAQRDYRIPTGTPPQGYFGKFAYRQSSGDLKPKTSVIEVPRETTKNHSFEKRKARGEIIVSPMKVGKLTITEHPYLVNPQTVEYHQQQRSLPGDPNFTTKTLLGRTVSIVSGKYVSGSWYAQGARTLGSAKLYMPFDKSRYTDLLSAGEISNKLVVDTAASLNEVTLDLLTNLAEFPETVKMVRDTLSFAGNKLKAFKTAEKRLKKKLLKQGIPQNELQGADALASLWLQFRYGIMPVYYTLQNIKDVLKDKFAAEYVKESKTLNHILEPENGFQGAMSSVSSCWMKRRFDPADFSSQFRRVFGVNPFVTAWELTTLSFVVDWFVNVGDVVSALSPIPSLEEKATFSWKNNVEGSITKPTFPEGRVDISLSYYEITPINYMDHVSLTFEPVLTTKRKLDALALSWSFTRSFFRSLK